MLNVTATSGLPITYSSSDNNIAKVEGNKIVPVNAGFCSIIANQAGNNIFPQVSVSTNIEVEKANQILTFTNNGLWAVSQTYTLNGSASSGLAVSYSVINGASKVNIVNNQVSFLANGEITIRATQSGNQNYFPSNTVDVNFETCSNIKPIIIQNWRCKDRKSVV